VYRTAGCDWTTEREGLTFESLAKGVCFKLELKDKTSNRVFVLERLTYGYNGNRVSSKLLFDAHYPDPKNAGKTIVYKSESMDEPAWDVKGKFLKVSFKFLKLGAVQELMYAAHIKLCRIGKSATSFNNKCDDPVRPGDSDFTAADGGKDVKPARRLLETSEYHRQRYLDTSKSTVV